MEFDDLYQDIILDHFRHPRHKRELTDSEVLVDEENPMCGDHIRLTASVKDGKITGIEYDGKGCAISMASASMMTDKLIGMPVVTARKLIRNFVGLLRGESRMSADELEDLAALEGVKQFPLRVKCATMSWHAVAKALEKLSPL